MNRLHHWIAGWTGPSVDDVLPSNQLLKVFGVARVVQFNQRGCAIGFRKIVAGVRFRDRSVMRLRATLNSQPVTR